MYHRLLRTGKLLLILFLFMLAKQSSAAVYTITSTSYANLVAVVGGATSGDIIDFIIPGVGTFVFDVTSPLIIPNGVTIDGTTQPGYIAPSGTNPGQMMICFLNLGGSINGIDLANTHDVTIKGIAFYGGFTSAIHMSGPNCYRNTITACYLGIRPDNTSSAGNAHGISITSGAYDNTIGGFTDADRNIISGNSAAGINMSGAGLANKIYGNYIGLAANNAPSNVNNDTGISITSSDSTIVGGGVAGGRNIISGNQNSGVLISGSNKCQVKGNYIGIDYTGMNPYPNIQGTIGGAIEINNGVKNIIGGTAPGDGNIISGNVAGGSTAPGGLYVHGTTCDSNYVLGNYFGLAPDGVSQMFNFKNIRIDGGAQHTFIGNGFTSGQNHIAYANQGGIAIAGVGTDGNKISNNQFYCNSFPILLLSGAHSNHPYPDILSASENNVNGTGFPGDSVEIYYIDEVCNHDEGKTFLGRALVNASGIWSLSGITLTPTMEVIALQYEVSTGTTSMFSNTRIVSGCKISNVTAGIDLEACNGTNVILQGSAVGNNQEGIWSTPAAGIADFSDVHDQNSTVTFPNNTTTEVIWTVENSLNGCKGADTIFVTTIDCNDPGIEVYNVLSPNNDGINDVLKILNIDYYEGATVTIYNRWGDKVYHATGYDNSEIVFTGQGNVGGNKNKDLPDGAYYYHIEYGGTTENGSLEIKK